MSLSFLYPPYNNTFIVPHNKRFCSFQNVDSHFKGLLIMIRFIICIFLHKLSYWLDLLYRTYLDRLRWFVINYVLELTKKTLINLIFVSYTVSQLHYILFNSLYRDYLKTYFSIKSVKPFTSFLKWNG